MLKSFLSVAFILFSIGSFILSSAQAQSIFHGEDGYRLWLKYDELPDAKIRAKYLKQFSHFYVAGDSATAQVITDELNYAFAGLLGKSSINRAKNTDIASSGLIIGNVKTLRSYLSKSSQFTQITESLNEINDEGFIIRFIDVNGVSKLFVLGKTDQGALYGTFHLLRLMQTQSELTAFNVTSSPKIDVRLLNHWDNLDRHTERGYAGESIWEWHKLPDFLHQRYYDYARANASIGINGTVLNNVNADPLILTEHYLEKVTALAALFRPYGIKVYLSVNFSSPHVIGGLKHSDPRDKNVQLWWRNKVAEIYRRIPDFGGFLVKANSEGQPGPGDYGRSHAEGANMLADALSPHGGVVMWRAFVYADENSEERSKQAYNEFKPLDGEFRDNVLVQVKNGPIDFQPREPISPLFGATPETPLMMEFQVTQEYLGFSTHWVYLGALYEEVLTTDTYAKGAGSTVAKVIDGSLFGDIKNGKVQKKVTGIAGVANIGVDRNWTGHIMNQANWYVFGRLAWDHQQDIGAIANDWIKSTLTHHQETVTSIQQIMMNSHQVLVDYMTPLGLHHIMGTGHHYGPGPWVDDLGRADWNPVYYHRADEQGLGFNRSPSGENAVEQYFSPLKEQYASPETTPEELLLWFHHLPWDYPILSTGRALWDELVHRYYQGAEAVKAVAAQWQTLKPYIDPLQFKQVEMSLAIQVKEAIWWRNACVLYFQSFSKRPIPNELEAPQGTLEYYKSLQFPYAPGQGE